VPSEAARSTKTTACTPAAGEDLPVAPETPRLRTPPIGFAHRGARAHAPENTLESFALALRLGAPGLESDVWISSDGEAILDHDGIVGWRRRPIHRFGRHALPGHMPTLDELYEQCGADFELSLDLKDQAAAPAVIAAARRHDALDRLWLCHPSRRVLTAALELDPGFHAVHSTRRNKVDGGEERWAASLADLGIDAVNLHHSEWSTGTVALFHRFERLCFGWDAQHRRVLDKLLGQGIDGLFSDHVDRMVEALADAS
jgi:glycerophosphoryl diester phosphodiesterase